jgi:hypothetical protein
MNVRRANGTKENVLRPVVLPGRIFMAITFQTEGDRFENMVKAILKISGQYMSQKSSAGNQTRNVLEKEYENAASGTA